MISWSDIKQAGGMTLPFMEKALDDEMIINAWLWYNKVPYTDVVPEMLRKLFTTRLGPDDGIVRKLGEVIGESDSPWIQKRKAQTLHDWYYSKPSEFVNANITSGINVANAMRREVIRPENWHSIMPYFIMLWAADKIIRNVHSTGIDVREINAQTVLIYNLCINDLSAEKRAEFYRLMQPYQIKWRTTNMINKVKWLDQMY